MNTKIQLKKIEYALLHNPTLIPVLLRDTSINKGFAHRIMKSYLPCRIGIEFEMGNSFKEEFTKKRGEVDLATYYNVLNISCDYKPAFTRTTPVCTYVDNSGSNVATSYIQLESDHDEPLVESRISIKDYHQLSGLYKFMQDLPEFCTLHEGGGIHIHVDVSKYYMVEDIVVPYLTKRLDEIGAIFPPYTGKFNKKKVGWRYKGTWVNVSNLNTLEFRIAPLTFDYTTLINWVFKLIKFRQKFIHDCRLYKRTLSKLTESVKAQVFEAVQGVEDLPTSNRWIENSMTVTQNSSGSYVWR